MKTTTLNQPPYRITPENPPQFPCWLWPSVNETWVRYSRWFLSPKDITGVGAYTHWHPDQPTAPTAVPEAESILDHMPPPSGYTPKPPHASGEDTALTRDKWDMDSLHDLYHGEGAPLVDFIITYVLSEINKQLGGKGWDAYESDGGLDDAIDYEIHTLLRKNAAIEEWGNRPLGPVLMALIRLSDNESKKGKFRVTLDYDNYQDGGRVLDGDGKELGKCYEDRGGSEDGEGADAQILGAIINAIDAARTQEGSKQRMLTPSEAGIPEELMP